MKNKEGMRWIVAISLSGAAVLLFLRMMIIWRDIEPSTGLFRPGAGLLCTIFNGVGVGLLVVAMVAAVLARNAWKKKAPAPKASPALEEEKAVREILDRTDPLFSEKQEAIEEDLTPRTPKDPDVKSATTWEGALSAFSYLLPGFGFLFFALSFVLQGSKDGLVLCFCLISAACGGYFLFTGIRNRADKNVGLAFFGLVPALWATFRMVIEYRDVEKYANRDMYTGNLLFLICVVCFFVYQAQVALGNEEYSMPLSWFASALLVVVFGLSTRLPQLLGLIFDRLGDMDLVDAAGLVLDLAITLFAGLKIRRMIR